LSIKQNPIKKIAITGPESTGKSVLAAELAKHYNTVWVPEYAREYLGGIQRPYEQQDLVKIAKGQLKSEAEFLKLAGKILFCDTDLTVIKIWSEYKYKSCDPWILENHISHSYDLHILCNIDLPWTPDPLREHPKQRKRLFELYIEEFEHAGFPYVIISGSGKERSGNAIKAIEERFDFTLTKQPNERAD